MKKLFFLAAALVAALAINAEVVYDWAEGVAANQKGITTIVSKVISSGDLLDNITTSTVKYDNNSTEVPALKFASSYKGTLKNKAGKDSVDVNGNKVQTLNYAELTVTGGFKKDDVVKYKACYNTSTAKDVQLWVLDADENEIHLSEKVVNGRDENSGLTEGSFKLTADLASMRLARSGGSALFVVSFTVERGSGTAIDNTEAEVKAVKTFENGQLVIIKNGVKYNATGAVIE